MELRRRTIRSMPTRGIDSQSPEHLIFAKSGLLDPEGRARPAQPGTPSMKTLPIAAPILFLCAAFAVQVQSHAQPTIHAAAAAATEPGPAPTGAAPVDSAYTVVARDGNQKLWAKLT